MVCNNPTCALEGTLKTTCRFGFYFWGLFNLTADEFQTGRQPLQRLIVLRNEARLKISSPSRLDHTASLENLHVNLYSTMGGGKQKNLRLKNEKFTF